VVVKRDWRVGLGDDFGMLALPCAPGEGSQVRVLCWAKFFLQYDVVYIYVMTGFLLPVGGKFFVYSYHTAKKTLPSIGTTPPLATPASQSLPPT